jgi:nucleoside phosphorylase
MNLIIMATFIEAKPFIELVPLTKIDQAPFPTFQNEDTVLVISGMGKVNAAMAVTHGCISYKPYRVLNFGAAGATVFSISLGDIYQIEKAIEYDGFYPKSEKLPTYTPNLLPGFQIATIATQDIPVIDPKHREVVSASAVLVDMEASAIIQVCRKFQTRCHLFKFVTDTPGHPCEGDIRKHIRQYRLQFYQFITGSVLPVLRK